MTKKDTQTVTTLVIDGVCSKLQYTIVYSCPIPRYRL